MRNDYAPGDLSVRISFGHVMGTGPGTGTVRPSIHVEDQTSGLGIELEITPAQLADMLSGSSAQVPATKVTGFKGIRNWGRYLKTMSISVASRIGDYSADPYALQYVTDRIAEIEAQGYVCDKPRRNNAQQWVLVGRRYDDNP